MDYKNTPEGTQTDIFLGEFVCDNRPPSTGTKFNHLDFLLSRLFTG